MCPLPPTSLHYQYSAGTDCTMAINSPGKSTVDLVEHGSTPVSIALASSPEDVTAMPTIGNQNWNANHVQGIGNIVTTNNTNYVVLSTAPKGLVRSKPRRMTGYRLTQALQEDIRAKITAGQMSSLLVTKSKLTLDSLASPTRSRSSL